MYSDAEGNGRIAAVIVLPAGAYYFSDVIDRRIRKKLLGRRTNIVPCELIAAIFAITRFSSVVPAHAQVVRFIENASALSCLIKEPRRVRMAEGRRGPCKLLAPACPSEMQYSRCSQSK